MEWYKIVALVCLSFCLISSFYHMIRLIRLGKPKDYSKRAGNTSEAIRYSFTGAMSPAKKESAFLHLPTYTAGIIFHLGTFLSILMFFVFISGLKVLHPINYFISTSLIISGICGIGILLKRVFTPKLRALSNPDDYISNIIVTVFHFATSLLAISASGEIFYFLTTSLLLLLFPLGKLKHTIYFFAARYHLGFFYGWRGVWPLK